MPIQVSEIAPDVFRIATYLPGPDLQFAQFVVRDEEPLLYHTGSKRMLEDVLEGVRKVVDPARIRWIGFSHYESDECGSLNDWLSIAKDATAVCSFVGAEVSVNDTSIRPARGMRDGEVFSTGKRRFRFLSTPHVPHCWEAGLLFEETEATLFCSDLFHQNGDVEALTEKSVLDRVRNTLVMYQASPFANYLPYTGHTDGIVRSLAKLGPKTLATMHGSIFHGDGAREIHGLADVLREVLAH